MRSVTLIMVIIVIGISACKKQQKSSLKDDLKNKKTISSNQNTPFKVCEDIHFNQAFIEIKNMLEGYAPLDFKRAAFLIEWAYSEGTLDYYSFCQDVSGIATKLQNFIHMRGLSRYKTAGNYALFEFFTKPHPMNNHQPYRYDFDDFYGQKDYTKIFITKLLGTHKGQCRSMPMLYKILSDEIGTESFLALGPNHMYIKHLDEQGKWVNIELTNGHFATDSWMISSMDISAESIRKGVYMKELNQEESVAFCLTELALAYEHKYGYDSLGIVASEITLQHFPNCISALMHKANTLAQMGKDYIEKHGRQSTPFLEANYAEYQVVEAKMITLGYREMSVDKYAAWVRSMEEERTRRASLIP